MGSVVQQLSRRATQVTVRKAFTISSRHSSCQGRRYYSSEPNQKASSAWIWLTGAGAAVSVGFYFKSYGATPSTSHIFIPTMADYQKVYNEVVALLEERDDYDDGSYGPVLLRLAWHASGTYDKDTGTGGSNGATMRFAPESGYGANAGLVAARDFLEPVKGRSL